LGVPPVAQALGGAAHFCFEFLAPRSDSLTV
jgi:hypothetical protein